jgi:hypothetical protein
LSASSQAIWVQATGARGPSLFLRLTWSGDSLRRLEVWSGQSFASSQWFCLQRVSPVSLQDFTIGGTLFCFLPLATILESLSPLVKYMFYKYFITNIFINFL